jgi:hypothetical protein
MSHLTQHQTDEVFKILFGDVSANADAVTETLAQPITVLRLAE